MLLVLVVMGTANSRLSELSVNVASVGRDGDGQQQTECVNVASVGRDGDGQQQTE